MAEKRNSASRSPNCIDTLIGEGVHIVGDIACTGVLRVQGDILGNVSCQDNSNGTLVVDSAGSVTGAINATHIAVRGRVIGPVQSSQSIEIHQGASLVGDISFKSITIHAGGVVEGLLNPAVAADSNESVPEHGPQVAEEPAVHESSTSIANGRGVAERLGGARKIGVAVLLVLAITAAWMGRDLAVIVRPADEVALRADSSLRDSAEPKSLPAGGGALPSEPKAVDAAGPAPSLSVGAQDAAQTPSPDRAKKDQEKVVTVRGTNPNRPAGVFLLISNNEPSVLYRKKRDDPGEGARISVSEGEKASVAIAPDELIRVAQGRDIVILFQGKKVSRDTIESGSWISFVPR